MIVYTPPHPAQTITTVDFSGMSSADPAARRAVAAEVHRACRETGFFYLIQHGIPQTLLDRQLAAARLLFSSSAADKDAIDARHSPLWRGYQPALRQRLDDGSPPDLKESFVYGREPVAGASRPDPAAAPNQWPEHLPDLEAQLRQFQTAMTQLGTRLLACIALSIDLPEDYFAAGLQRPQCSVRLLHYPPQPADAQFNQLGAGAHTDWGSITLLLQDAVGGLEVQNSAGTWINAQPLAGSFIINIGQLMERLTNRLYKATLHRVLNNGMRDRYSVATFFDLDFDFTVECAPTCRDLNGGVVPPPITVGQHIEEMTQLTAVA